MTRASKGQGAPRTMTAGREGELRSVVGWPMSSDGVRDLWAELDAERAAHERTLAILADMLFDVGMLNREMRDMREKYLGNSGGGVASNAVGIMAQRINRHIAVDSAARAALAQARIEARP